jgi:iron complex transport system ATP-binding protein
MIQVKDLTFEFYNKQLFKQMNLLFESNKVHTIYGDNGIGKTTFFQLLTGLQRNYEGQVLIQNNDIYMLNSFQLSDLISICYASQPQSEIFVHEVFSFSQIMDHDRDHIINLFEIKDFMNRNIQELSEGERQWIFIARAIARNTPIILLDEPTAFLDLSKRKKLKEIILQFSKNHTILINSHDEHLSKMPNSIIWEIDNQTFNQKINLN